MGTGKKEKSRVARQGKPAPGMDNIKTKGENFYRSAKKVKALNLRKDEGKPQRNARGDITQAAKYQSRDAPVARVAPSRSWFTNTRVISQDSLSSFRDAMAEKAKDPYQVLLKSNKLPMSLIRDGSDTNGLKQHKAKMQIATSPYASVFGPKSTRKRVKLDVSSMADLAEDTEKSMDTYQERLEQAKLLSGNSADAEVAGDMDTETADPLSLAIEPVFAKGQSKRIYNELYKVLDSSDVVIHVLDARDPLGTRCFGVEKYLKKEAPHAQKHLIFVLNKTDLVPTSVAAAWVRHLSADYPTLAFHSSITNSFGKGSLIQLLRQFSSLHSGRKQISVGLIGYPNVGKSSVINTLRSKKVCTIAPIPGETKVWQYITLMKKIYLIDCPGVVPPNQDDTPQDILLRGVCRVEKVEDPSQYIPALLSKVKTHHMERTYQLKGWTDHIHFLEMLARKSGRLIKGGEPDVDGVAKMVLTDFMRGKIPWFTPAPVAEDGDKPVEGRQGRLGEMPLKRKRDDLESVADTTSVAPTQDDNEEGSDDEEFEGFDSDSESDEEAIVEAKTAVKKAVAQSDEAADGDDMIPLDASSEEDESSEEEDE